jgi:hypothetical protein
MKLSQTLNNKSRHIGVAFLACLLAACGGGGGSSSTTTPTLPNVILTIPAKTVPIVTGVATNSSVTAKFSAAMLASSINTSNVKLSCPSSTPVVGTVTYDSANRLAIFRPTSALPINTTCEATITTGVKDSEGDAMAKDYVWSFTTGAGPDIIAPTVVSNSPASGQCLSATISATFSESMDPSTINATTFNITNGGVAVSGAVTYDALSKTAKFAVTNPPGFIASTAYIATVTTGAKDLAGLALATDFTFGFTTGTSACGASIVNLGTIAPFGSFGGGAGATNSGLNTVINGDLGTTGVCTTITGFHDSTGQAYTETPLIEGNVTGIIYCAPPSPGTVEKLAVAAQAATDARTAYIALRDLPGGTTISGDLSTITLPLLPPGTLTPGIYTSASTMGLTAGDLILDAGGNADATWVFQVGSALTVGLPATPRSITLAGGAQAKNVFWQVYSAARIEVGSNMVGTIIAQAGVTISTAIAGTQIQTTLDGRAIGLDASVTMVNTTINVPE